MEVLALCLAFITVLNSVRTAPVSQNDLDDITSALKTQLKDQEQALASLGSLQDEVNSQKSLGISHSKSFSYSNINGAVQQEETQEHKVTNPEEQKVISDLKEHVKQSQDSPDLEPNTSFQASLDIPAEGIHKEITNGDDVKSSASLNMQPEAFKDTIEFTPEVVAQYLYDHDAKEDFLSLLNELVETSEITSEEAEQYEKSVMDELYKLEQTEKRSENDATMPLLDQLYPQGYGVPQQPMLPMYNDEQARDDIYPLYGYGPQVPMKSQVPENMDSYMNYVVNKPVTLDNMINTLLDEWLTKAVVTGDPEAEEILTNIVDYVSRDNNPNDEEQVKAVLGDIFAEALLEDLTPRIQPEDLKDMGVLSPSDSAAVLEPVPVPIVQGAGKQEQLREEPVEDSEEETNEEDISEADAKEEETIDNKLRM